jgi:hypothetical protein
VPKRRNIEWCFKCKTPMRGEGIPVQEVIDKFYDLPGFSLRLRIFLNLLCFKDLRRVQFTTMICSSCFLDLFKVERSDRDG